VIYNFTARFLCADIKLNSSFKARFLYTSGTTQIVFLQLLQINQMIRARRLRVRDERRQQEAIQRVIPQLPINQ
jgi:hypothetical protein